MDSQSRSQTRRETAARAMRDRPHDRRRNLALLALTTLVVVGVALVLVRPFGNEEPSSSSAQDTAPSAQSAALTSIGAPAERAGCLALVTRRANGNGYHVSPSQPLRYDASPPAFGKHYPVWATITRKFYTAADRPPLGELVHNLEHGYNVLWYDETVAQDPKQVAQLRAIAGHFNEQTQQGMFIVAPWTKEDGKPFRQGRHIALTHWLADPRNPARQSTQRGVWQFCSRPSGAVVADFVSRYGWQRSPEPGIL